MKARVVIGHENLTGAWCVSEGLLTPHVWRGNEADKRRKGLRERRRKRRAWMRDEATQAGRDSCRAGLYESLLMGRWEPDGGAVAPMAPRFLWGGRRSRETEVKGTGAILAEEQQEAS